MPWVKRTKGWDSGGVAFPRELWAWSLSFLLLAEIPQSRVHTRCLGRRENKVWWGLTLCPLLLQWLRVPCVGELYLNQVWPVETHSPPSPPPPADQEPKSCCTVPRCLLPPSPWSPLHTNQWLFSFQHQPGILMTITGIYVRASRVMQTLPWHRVCAPPSQPTGPDIAWFWQPLVSLK